MKKLKVFTPVADLTRPGIDDSDFTRSFFLLRMQIALEEIRERMKTLQDAEEIESAQAELAASEHFYEQYLSTFN